jgi:hypothetical protein
MSSQSSPLQKRVSADRERQARAAARAREEEFEPTGFETPASTLVYVPPTRKLFGDTDGSEEVDDKPVDAEEEKHEGVKKSKKKDATALEKKDGEDIHEVSATVEIERLPERRSLLQSFKALAVAEPEVFLVNKVCAEVPVEGTPLGERFNQGFTKARVSTMAGVYREIQKEAEAKERFASFEKDFESSKGNELTQVIHRFNLWCIENVGCDEFQGMALTWMVGTRRLMADSKRSDDLHARMTLDFIGHYLSQEDSEVEAFKTMAVGGTLQGERYGGGLFGLERLKMSIEGGNVWTNEFVDVYVVWRDLLAGDSHAIIDAEPSLEAFRVEKGVKHHLSQKINEDGTVEAIMHWLLRTEAAIGQLERVAIITKRPELEPSVINKVEMSLNSLNGEFVDKGLFKIMRSIVGLQFTQDAKRVPIFVNWEEFVRVLRKAEVLFREKENFGYRVRKGALVEAKAKAGGALENDAICAFFKRNGHCNKGRSRCPAGTHPTALAAKPDAAGAKKAAGAATRKEAAKAQDTTPFVPPAPVGERAVAAKTTVGSAGAAKTPVGAQEEAVKAVCRVCEVNFESLPSKFTGQGMAMPKTCPKCCKERAERARAVALMVTETSDDECDGSEEEEEVLMVVAVPGMAIPVPWMALQEVTTELQSQDQEGVRVILHSQSIMKVLRGATAGGVVAPSPAWIRAVLGVCRRMQETERLCQIRKGTVDVDHWLAELVEAVLAVRDGYGDFERRVILGIVEETCVEVLSDKGVAVLGQIVREVLHQVQVRMEEAYKRQWLQRTHTLRLVCKEFGAMVDWIMSVDKFTSQLRKGRCRQKRIGEFFSAKVGGPAQVEVGPAQGEEGAAFVVKGKVWIDEWSWNEPGEAEVLEIASPNIYQALELEEDGSGNEEVDRRAGMTVAQLLNELRAGRSRRSQCTQEEPAWMVGRELVGIEEEPEESPQLLSDEQSSDESDELLRELEAEQSRLTGRTRDEPAGVLGRELVCIEDESEGSPQLLSDEQSSGDSEYWEAVLDSDLSSASIITDSEDSDFQ